MHTLRLITSALVFDKSMPIVPKLGENLKLHYIYLLHFIFCLDDEAKKILSYIFLLRGI